MCRSKHSRPQTRSPLYNKGTLRFTYVYVALPSWVAAIMKSSGIEKPPPKPRPNPAQPSPAQPDSKRRLHLVGKQSTGKVEAVRQEASRNSLLGGMGNQKGVWEPPRSRDHAKSHMPYAANVERRGEESKGYKEQLSKEKYTAPKEIKNYF